jgi:hypothetical protein
MKRNPEMQKFVDSFTKKAFGRTMDQAVCVTCGSTKIGPGDFRNALSRKEFTISHMCQECQDSVFGAD